MRKVKLTQAAHRILPIIRSVNKAIDEATTKCFDDKSLAELRSMLLRMKQNLDQPPTEE